MNQQNIEIFWSALGGATIPVVALGYLWRTIIDHRLKKDLDDYKDVLAEQASIRTTVKKYSRVILVSTADLQDRLWHLCERQSKATNKVLLAKDELSPMYETWPMTKRHYLIGTMYLFAKYFSWIEILKSRIRLLEFNDETKTSVFNYHLKRVERSFAESSFHNFADHNISKDIPLFQLMQSEIGECLRTESGGEEQCMSFHDFKANYDEMIKTNDGFQQLEALLISSMSVDPGDFCLTRLKLVCNALLDLVEFLCNENKLSQSEKLERVTVESSVNDQYLAIWPSSPKPSFLRTVFGR